MGKPSATAPLPYRGPVLSVELLGVGAHGVFDHRADGAVVLGELFDQIRDVLGHPYPELNRGFPARPAPAALGRNGGGSATGAACTGGDDSCGVASWGEVARGGV